MSIFCTISNTIFSNSSSWGTEGEHFSDKLELPRRLALRFFRSRVSDLQGRVCKCHKVSRFSETFAPEISLSRRPSHSVSRKKVYSMVGSENSSSLALQPSSGPSMVSPEAPAEGGWETGNCAPIGRHAGFKLRLRPAGI